MVRSLSTIIVLGALLTCTSLALAQSNMPDVSEASRTAWGAAEQQLKQFRTLVDLMLRQDPQSLIYHCQTGTNHWRLRFRDTEQRDEFRQEHGGPSVDWSAMIRDAIEVLEGSETTSAPAFESLESAEAVEALQNLVDPLQDDWWGAEQDSREQAASDLRGFLVEARTRIYDLYSRIPVITNQTVGNGYLSEKHAVDFLQGLVDPLNGRDYLGAGGPADIASLEQLGACDGSGGGDDDHNGVGGGNSPNFDGLDLLSTSARNIGGSSPSSSWGVLGGESSYPTALPQQRYWSEPETDRRQRAMVRVLKKLFGMNSARAASVANSARVRRKKHENEKRRVGSSRQRTRCGKKIRSVKKRS